jgi:hypothetical protein
VKNVRALIAATLATFGIAVLLALLNSTEYADAAVAEATGASALLSLLQR